MPQLWLLGIASGLSPFGMAIILPALGGIAERFSANFDSVQFLVSAYLLGLGLAQPICGYCCDRYGRRKVMLAGFAIFTAASAYCAFAPSLTSLIIGRFFQAVGVSVGTVSSRAILRDTRNKNQMAIAMSYIAAATGLAPIIAPVVGGMLNEYASYTHIFTVSALLGATVFLYMLFSLGETLDQNQSVPNIRDWFASYRYLLRSPSFMGHTLVFGFMQGSIFSFLSVGADIFSRVFGIGSSGFGIIWGLSSVSFVIGAAVGAKATTKFGMTAVLRCSIVLALISGIVVWVFSLSDDLSVAHIVLPLSLLMVFTGMATPSSLTGAVADHPTIAGTASGLSSAIGLVVGGSFAIMSGIYYDGSYTPAAQLVLLATLAAAASLLLANVKRQNKPLSDMA